jgi:hypothetical protein
MNEDHPGSGTAQEPEPRRRRHVVRRIALWAVPIVAGAILISYAVPGAHNVITTGVCYFKFAISPRQVYPKSSDWISFGTTQMADVSSSSLEVRPSPSMGAQDEWFGASLPVVRFCDYQIKFQAKLIGPLYPVPTAGYGYAIGSRGKVVNGVPEATTIQYDPPFGGLRTVDVPLKANAGGYNAIPFSSVNTGHYHHWVLTVRGDTMLALLDGKSYAPVSIDTGHGHDVVLRIWNAEVEIRSVVITKLHPSL